MAKKREEPSKSESVAFRLEHVFPDHLSVGSFANHMVVQRDEHNFHISFFQVVPPIILGTESERREQAHKLVSVPAKCVARIVVAEGYLEKVIGALQDNLEQTKKSHPAQTNGQGKAHDKTA